MVYWGYNPLILTIDPNFRRDLQASVPQKTISARWFKPWRVSTMLWNRQRQVNVAAETLGWGVNWVAPLAVGAIAGPAVVYYLINIRAGVVAPAILQGMGKGTMQVMNVIGMSDRECLILASSIVGSFGVFHNNVGGPNGAIWQSYSDSQRAGQSWRDCCEFPNWRNRRPSQEFRLTRSWLHLLRAWRQLGHWGSRMRQESVWLLRVDSWSMQLMTMLLHMMERLEMIFTPPQKRSQKNDQVTRYTKLTLIRFHPQPNVDFERGSRFHSLTTPKKGHKKKKHCQVWSSFDPEISIFYQGHPPPKK